MGKHRLIFTDNDVIFRDNDDYDENAEQLNGFAYLPHFLHDKKIRDNMAKNQNKKTKQSEELHYELNPDVVAAANLVGRGAVGAFDLTKKGYNFVKKNIPGKEQELAKLRAEVAALEGKKEIDKQIEALKAKKKQLEEAAKTEKEAYA